MYRGRILFMGHSGSRGGAPLSLLYLAKGARDYGYIPVVALPHGMDSAVGKLYKSEGLEVVPIIHNRPIIHCTAGWARAGAPLSVLNFFQSLLRWQASIRETFNIIQETQPDLVHLNSVVLLPNAIAVSKYGLPLVWHVRESPVRGYFGLRTRLISKALVELPTELVFISNHDRRSWVADRRGSVVWNYVHPEFFNRSLDAVTARAALNIDTRAPVLLYLGGFWDIKGPLILLEALPQLRRIFPNLVCLMPNTINPYNPRCRSKAYRALRALAGSPVTEDAAQRKIDKYHLHENLRLLPFEPDVVSLMRIADVVVFPSIQPHFARPVIEAAAAGKAVVASRIGGVEELVEEGITGMLTEPGDSDALAEAIGLLLGNPDLRTRLGEAAHKKAEKEFSWQRGVTSMVRIFDRAASKQNG